jgi:hypothetical protein
MTKADRRLQVQATHNLTLLLTIRLNHILTAAPLLPLQDHTTKTRVMGSTLVAVVGVVAVVAVVNEMVDAAARAALKETGGVHRNQVIKMVARRLHLLLSERKRNARQIPWA